MTKNEHITINIKGIPWKIYVHNPTVYRRKHGSDSSAITYPEDYEIHFKKDHIRYGTVLHELGHALTWSSGSASTNMDKDQMEELIWGLMEDHYFDLGNWARIVQDYIAKQAMKK